jgi:N4-gp56 family major capsid protein
MNTVTITALRQELWAKELFADARRDVENIMQFMGEGADSVIQVKRELAKEKGDTQTFGLRGRLTGNGVVGDDEMEGSEESMLTYDEQVAIDQIRNAVRLKGMLDAQTVTYDGVKEAQSALKDWLVEYQCRQFFHKLGGVTNTSLTDVEGTVVGTRCTWSNTPDYIPDADEAYTGNRYRYMNVGGVSTASMTTSHTMTLDTVTRAAMKARLASPRIQMLKSGGESFYVMYLHPIQARDIRLSSDWKDAQAQAQMRGDKNPIFRGALGYWSNVLLLENEFVPWLDVSVAGNSFRAYASGTDCAVDCSRALLCGRQAALFAEARPGKMVLKEFDYNNKPGACISLIGGIQKPVFNSKEVGVIAVDSYAAL